MLYKIVIPKINYNKFNIKYNIYGKNGKNTHY